MKRHKPKKGRRFSPAAFTALVYNVLYVVGILLIIGAIVYAFDTLRPRLFGEPALARAIEYTSFNADPASQKTVRYTFTVAGDTVTATQEISGKAYEDGPETFRVWYMPGNVQDTYVAVRTYWDIVLAGFAIVIGGILFLLPGLGRAVDDSRGQGDAYTVPACICGVSPSKVLRLSASSRLQELFLTIVFIGFGATVVALGLVEAQHGGLQYAVKLSILFTALYAGPFIWAIWRLPDSYANHSLKCQFRRAWFTSFYKRHQA